MVSPDRSTKTNAQELGNGLITFRLEVASGQDAGKVLLLEKNHNCIGNLETCDLVLEDEFISRKHCELICAPQGHILRDLQSKNGTFVNGLKISEVKLIPGALIRVGQTNIFYQVNQSLDALPLSAQNSFGEVLGHSPRMKRLFTMLNQIAPTDITILIEGETGTGKDVTARSIHAKSHRASGPFVVVDCGAVASNLIESDLFGHERGSFTGANQRRAGAFERGQGGTLFLDEIGELSLELQPKLLRVLEDKKIQRVGGSESIPVNVRIIAATNRTLAEEVRNGRFRQDLYYRLSVLRIQTPPLRERLEDIPFIVESMIQTIPSIASVSPEAIQLLLKHSWPGNIRELRNVIQRAAALTKGEVIQPEMIHFEPSTTKMQAEKQKDFQRLATAPASLEATERQTILDTLKQCNWNKSEAAKRLDIASSTLYSKLKKHNIKDPE